MNKNINKKIGQAEEKLIDATVSALNDLPILARLEFAKNMVFHVGGDKNGLPQDLVLIAVHDVLDDIAEVLKKHPAAAQLRSPEP
jgi:hypothetical protein